MLIKDSLYFLKLGGENMTKKYGYLIWTICVSMALFMLAGCEESRSKTVSLQNIINLSGSDISSIKISEGGGMQTKIEDSKEIEEICSFLSNIDLSQEYVEEKVYSESSGGSGTYFLITYSNNTLAHVQIYSDDNQVKINGDTNNEIIENKWRVYTISEPSQITKIKEVLSKNE